VLKAGPLSAGVFTQATWADSKAANSLYGRDAGAIGRRWPGPRSTPAPRMMFASIGVLGSVDLGPRWLIVGSLEERRLRGMLRIAR